jgi:hypothetical protein
MFKPKTPLIVIFSLATLFSFSCEHSVVPNASHYYFEIKLNGSRWYGRSEAELRKNGQLVVWGIKGESLALFEDIFVEITFNGEGTYKINSQKAVWRSWEGGDVIVGFVASKGSNMDKLIITKYDQSTGIIQGTCSFEAGSENRVIKFTEGQFVAKIGEVE